MPTNAFDLGSLPCPSCYEAIHGVWPPFSWFDDKDAAPRRKVDHTGVGNIADPTEYYVLSCGHTVI